MTTLATALESALLGQATPAEVIAAIDEELTGKICVLVSIAYNAARQVNPVISKLPKPYKEFPICHTIHIETKDGRVNFTGLFWDDEKQCLDKVTQTLPARIDREFSTCVPAKQFTQWLKASQLTTDEKRKGVSERMEITHHARTETLVIKIGNSRAEFKCIDSAEFP